MKNQLQLRIAAFGLFLALLRCRWYGHHVRWRKSAYQTNADGEVIDTVGCGPFRASTRVTS